MLTCLIEVNAGAGKLIAIRLDLGKKDPATLYFIDHLIRYAVGPDFNPAATVDIAFLRQQAAKTATIRKHIVAFKKDGVMPNLKRPDEE